MSLNLEHLREQLDTLKDSHRQIEASGLFDATEVAVIENAISRFTDGELSETQNRINGLWSEGRGDKTINALEGEVESKSFEMPKRYKMIIEQAEKKLDDVPEDDRDEIINLIEDIRDFINEGKMDEAEESIKELDDILFYLGES